MSINPNETNERPLTPNEIEAIERSIFERMMNGEFDEPDPTATTDDKAVTQNGSPSKL